MTVRRLRTSDIRSLIGTCGGDFVTQAFQKAIMQWLPGKGVFFVNIFDELHNAGKDDLLRVRWATPPALEFDPVDWDWDETVKWSLDLLNKPGNQGAVFCFAGSVTAIWIADLKGRRYGRSLRHPHAAGGVSAVEGRRALGEGRRGDRCQWGDIAKQVGRRCETNYYGPDRCTYLLFPGEALEIHGPEALIPQPVGFVGARPP